MQQFNKDLILGLMKFCDLQGLNSLGLTCKLYYHYYQPIQHIIQGLSHPDHLAQLITLRRLMNTMEQKDETLRDYYPILIEQFHHYIKFDDHSVRKLYAYMLIIIMTSKINNFFNSIFAIEQLKKECITKEDSYTLFHYALCRINKILNSSDIEKITNEIIKKIKSIRGPYNHIGEEHTWLYKFTLLDISKKTLSSKQRKYLLKQICQWFQEQEAVTYDNSIVLRDMYLNVRWLVQGQSQKKVFKWVSQEFIKILIPLSNYNWKKEIPCLDCDEALDIFLLVGVDHFSQLLQDRKLTLKFKHAFLDTLSKCQQYTTINKLVTQHLNYFIPLNKSPWKIIKAQLKLSEKIISSLDSSIFNYNIDALIDTLKEDKDKLKLELIIDLFKKTETLLTENRQERIYQLVLLWIEDSYTGIEPWELKELLSEDKYNIIEKKHTDIRLTRYNDYYSFRVILYAKQDPCRQLMINSIEDYLNSKSVYLHELNVLVNNFENLLTPKMRESILSQYQKHLLKEIENDAYHDDCRSAYRILIRWNAFQSFENTVKNLLLTYFKQLKLNDEKSIKFNLSCDNANNYLRLYSSLFPEDDNLYHDFFLKLKPIVYRAYRKTWTNYSLRRSTRTEMLSLLFRTGLRVANEIIEDMFLPMLNDQEVEISFIQECFQYIPKDLLTTKLIPVLLLQRKRPTVAQTLIKTYSILTPKQRQTLCDDTSSYQSTFVELANIYPDGVHQGYRKK